MRIQTDLTDNKIGTVVFCCSFFTLVRLSPFDGLHPLQKYETKEMSKLWVEMEVAWVTSLPVMGGLPGTESPALKPPPG